MESNSSLKTTHSPASAEAGVAWQLLLRFRQWKERNLPIGSYRRRTYDSVLRRFRRRLTAELPGATTIFGQPIPGPSKKITDLHALQRRFPGHLFQR
jgi:hypothetical protein